MPKIEVVLSGCGLREGSEIHPAPQEATQHFDKTRCWVNPWCGIHESVLTLLALAQAGAQAVCMAPNTTPAYLLAREAAEAWEGIEKLVKKILEFTRQAGGA